MASRPVPASRNAGCIFCSLVTGSAEVSICYEDDVALAFMDIQPVNPGHVLVIPRDHYETLQDIPRAVGWHLFQVTTRLIPLIQKVAGADDMNVIVNSGPAAGQNVFHYHIHLIPRKKGDGFDVPLPFPGSEMPNRHMLDAMAVRIGQMLRADPARQTPKSDVREVNPAERMANADLGARKAPRKQPARQPVKAPANVPAKAPASSKGSPKKR